LAGRENADQESGRRGVAEEYLGEDKPPCVHLEPARRKKKIQSACPSVTDNQIKEETKKRRRIARTPYRKVWGRGRSVQEDRWEPCEGTRNGRGGYDEGPRGSCNTN